MRKGFLDLKRIGCVICFLLVTSCGEGVSESERADGGERGSRARQRDVRDIETWVDVYYPQEAVSGYNLLLYRRRQPTLVDLNGRVVHGWPKVRAAGRARLLANGSLLVIDQDGAVREYSWEGEPVWEYRLAGEDFPHHDLIELASGSRLVLAHDQEKRLDYLVEVTAAGEVVWRWDAAEHLANELHRAGDVVNRTHINSVHELGANRWWTAGDERFRPGNLLISARNLNAIYVLDKKTGRVVWNYYGELDHQHEAILVPEGRPGAGNILVFNNGLRDLHRYRESSVLEIDPSSREVVWSYEAPNFFSSTGGTQQSLPGGNLLVTSSRGGRIFEITREGKIVWQMTPTYNPMRVERYPYDHTPQLAELPPAVESRVEARNPRRHVDEDLYTFALPHQTRQVRFEETKIEALPEKEICRRLLLPDGPQLSLGWGIKPRPAEASREIEVELEVRVEAVDGEPRTILARTERFSLDDPEAILRSHRERFDLGEYGLRDVELCLSARSPNGKPAAPVFSWTPPVIRSRARLVDDEMEEVDPKVKEVQEKHLKALGYID